MKSGFARLVVSAALALGTLAGGVPAQAAVPQPQPTYTYVDAATWYWRSLDKGTLGVRFLPDYEGVEVMYQRRNYATMWAKLSYGNSRTGKRYGTSDWQQAQPNGAVRRQWYGAPGCVSGRLYLKDGTFFDTPTICRFDS